MTSMFDTALEIAKEAHAYQKYGDQDYIVHPLMVSAVVSPFGNRAMTTAVLHDVLEDSSVTSSDLLLEGIDASVVRAVELVSRPESVSYQEWISSIVYHPYPESLNIDPSESEVELGKEPVSLHMLIKTADLMCNLSSLDDTSSLRSRYLEALGTIQERMSASVFDVLRQRVEEATESTLPLN